MRRGHLGGWQHEAGDHEGLVNSHAGRKRGTDRERGNDRDSWTLYSMGWKEGLYATVREGTA